MLMIATKDSTVYATTQSSTFACLAEQTKAVRLPTITASITRGGSVITAARETSRMTRYTTTTQCFTTHHRQSNTSNVTSSNKTTIHGTETVQVSS